eukprot:2723574-Alexandrium_andersonii.AAC.1
MQRGRLCDGVFRRACISRGLDTILTVRKHNKAPTPRVVRAENGNVGLGRPVGKCDKVAGINSGVR